MSGRYMKTLVVAIVVLAVSFGLPNVFADQIPWDLNLSLTSDSITIDSVNIDPATTLPDGIPMSFHIYIYHITPVPSDERKIAGDALYTYDPTPVYYVVTDTLVGQTFGDLEIDNYYAIFVNIYYDAGQGFKYFHTTENKIIHLKDQFVPEPEIVEEKVGNGCSGDCTPPTIGLDEDNKRLVDNGFSYNNNPVDVIAWHTPYPLITAIVNQTNTVEIIAYDNGGIFNLAMVQFGLGLEGLGQPLHDVEVLIEVHLEPLYSENKVIVEKVVIRDRDNLIDTYSVFAITETVQCIDDAYDNKCLKVTLQYSYREATINNMMVVNVMDIARNTQNFYLNEGVEVIGDSMNPTPFVILPNKQTSQQTENLTKALFQIDKVNDIWLDGDGVKYQKTGDRKFDRITPLEPITCNDTPLDQVKVPTRQNCHFRALTDIWNK